MKVLRWLNVLAVVAMLLSVLPVQAAAPAMPDKQPTQQATGGDDPLRRLQDATGGTVRVSTNDATGVANFVSLPAGALPAFKLARQEKAVATDRAQAFFKEYGGLFGIRDAGSELQLLDVAADQYGAMHVEYVQVYQGVPVFASSLRAHFDKDGQLTAVNGVFIPKVGVNTTPALSADQAAEIAVAHVENPVAQTSDAAGESRKDSGLKASGPTLYVFRANLVQGIPGANHLAYEVEVANGRDVREFVYVDAHTGAVIEQFTGMYDALNRRAFNGEANHPATPYWVEGQTFPTANTEANNVIYASGEIYNIIGSLTGGTYLSWDGADAVMDNIFNATGLTCPNAQWTGTYSRFCTGVTGDDTVGHEWGHAYTQGTHNLIYAWQSGALSESYSDVWGEVVDLLNGRGTDTPGGSRTNGSCSTYGAGTPSVDATYRWLSGEDDPSMGVIRDMWRPSCYGDPDMVSGAGYVCSTTDNGGVHTNCGVPNHAFALLVDGGTFNGQTIAGIGLTRAAHLYWRTQSVYQTPTSDFQVHADALRQSCADLTGADLRELSTVTTTTGISADKITASHCAELEKVIAAVELETEPTQCGFVPMLETPAPALCSPLETTSSVLTQDWEAGMGTWAIGTRNVAQPGSLDSLNWFVETTLPDGRAGQAAFAEDSTDKGDCSADDESSVRYLESPNITVPTGGDLRLAFDHWAAMELGWDGGNVKISVNGGVWQLVPASAFTFNAYPGTLDTLANGNTNPMAGEAAFTGANGGENSGSWGQSQVNLSGLASAGDVIKLRFEIGIDGCNGSTGWYVDTVQVYQCVAAPVGELNGTVTNASTSAPIAGAQIEAVTNPTFNATTDAAGEYAMSVIAGTYVVTASAFGYNTASASGVVVAEGAPTTQDFALTQMPAATLSGVVYDSATNWPLYASIAIDGDAGSATIWTDPETGAYSIEAPTGVSFTLEVAAWVTGYTPETLEVQLSGAATQDFALDADSAACNAPGYAIVGLSEGFESTTFPPTGWARFRGVNGLGTVQDWVRTATAYAGSGAAYVQYENVTGGLAQDWLVTPQVRPTAGSSTLSFYMRQTYGTNYGSTYTIRVSTNSQTTHGDFTTVQTYAEGDFTTTYQQFTVDLSAYVDQDIYIAFVMEQDDGDDWYLDNVEMAAVCTAPTGGLVVGNVYDANTGDGINDATVSGAGSAATTAGTPDDPAVADGFYTLYSPAGSQTFTAAKALYGDDSETATIAAGDTERVDFTLSSPVLVYAPDAFNVWLSANQQTVETLTLSNTGSAAMDWTLIKTGIPGGAFSNGPLVTHPGGGAGGADASALQGALGLTSYGTGHALSSGYRVADDFTLPAGGQIDTIVFYAYQTGSSTTSTINHVNLRIWRGRPGDPGSVVIWGDTTTNRMVSSVWSNIYRVLDTAMTGSTRPIMANTVNVGVLLPPGTYWLDWQTGGTLASGPWAPAISILGQTTTGNARQWDGDTLSWGDVLDGVYPQGFPFVLNGPADVAPWVSLSSASGSTAQGANTPVDFTFDSTGLTSGVYEAFVAITSTDPLRTVPPVVSMRLAVDANFASIQTGAWSGTAWASGSPTAGDWVTITTGHVVTVDSANAHCYNLHVEAGGTLVIPAGSSLTVERAVTNNGTLRQTRNVAASGSTRFLNLQNQAGTASAYYGVDITPSAGSGSTTVEVRGNQAACTQNGGAGDTALLKRCFEIDTPVTNATVRFWYIAPELNGQAPDALRLWHYDGANVWSEAGSGAYSYSGATCTGDDQCWVQRGGVSAFSPFTVGGPTAPTATTLRALVAQNGVYAVLGLALVAALGLVVLRRRKA